MCVYHNRCSQNKKCKSSITILDFKNKPACFCTNQRKILIESVDWNDMGGHTLEELSNNINKLIKKYKYQDTHIIVEGSCIDIYMVIKVRF